MWFIKKIYHSPLETLLFHFKRQLTYTDFSPLNAMYSTRPFLISVISSIANSRKKITLSPEMRYLIRVFVAELNRPSLCTDMRMVKIGKFCYPSVKLSAIRNFRNEKTFTNAEKSLLEFCEQATLTKSCTNKCFNELKQYFSEKQIVEITWLTAIENYYHLQENPLVVHLLSKNNK